MDNVIAQEPKTRMDDRRKKVLKIFKEVKSAPFGEDFVDYLAQLSQGNYEDMKFCDRDALLEHRGYAIAVDSLLKLFAECDKQHHDEYVPDRL